MLSSRHVQKMKVWSGIAGGGRNMWFPVILALLATLSLILGCAAVLGVIVRRVYAPVREAVVREATVLEYAAPEHGLARL